MNAARHSRVGGNPGKSGNPVIDHLDLWSSVNVKKAATGRGSNGKISPYGIQKLRDLILELAVRGKLVSQDPNDESARVLLEKITKEEASLLKEGLIKKHMKFPEIQDDEKSIEIPDSWAWIRARRIGHDWGQKVPDKDFSYIDVSAIDNHSGKVINPSVLSPAEAPSRARKIVKKGTVIYSTVRPYLKNIAVVEEVFDPEPIASTAFAILHPYAGIPGDYLVAFFRSPVFVRYVESVQTGIAYPAINDKQFYGSAFPLPPLAEQHRIVAKVDELMALCDQLEQQQTSSLQAHQALVETLLRTLVDAGSAENTQQAWNRIAEHFDTLFATEESIDQLKQTILQLAVMGRLVSQDLNEEPASVLLENIAEHKASLVKDKKIRKQKALPEVTEEEMLYKPPSGWKWCRLQGLVYLLGDGLHGTPEYTPDESYYFVNGNNLRDGRIIIKPDTKTVAFDQYEKHRKELGDNTVLVSINGTLGNVAFYRNEEIILGKSACYFNLAETINKEFIKIVIESPGFMSYALENATGSTIKNLGLKAMNNLPVALPPLAEQHRIVAKVDELMALCDALKVRIQEAQASQVNLADTIVDQAAA